MSVEGKKIGKVLPMPKGLYDPDTNYLYLDIVRYEGASYICKEACIGELPTNPNYWQMISKDGNIGYFESGDSLDVSTMTEPDEVGQIISDELPDTMFNKITTMIKNVRWLLFKHDEIKEELTTFNGVAGGDAWTAKSYTKGQTVLYDNKVYLCKANCTAANLPTDTNYWKETSLAVLNNTLGTLITTSNYTLNSQTANANATVSWDIDISKNGYTPLGIVQFQMNQSASHLLVQNYIQNNILKVTIKNIGSTSYNYMGGVFTILYIKG